MLSYQPLFLPMRGGTSLCGNQSASISKFVQGSLRKTKTDKKDAMTIAQFLLNNERKLCVITSSQDAQDLRDLARERESQSWMIASLKNDLKRLLQNTFPELETLRKNIYTETMLNFVLAVSIGQINTAGKEGKISTRPLFALGRSARGSRLAPTILLTRQSVRWAQLVQRRSLLSLRRQQQSYIFRRSVRRLQRHWWMRVRQHGSKILR